MAAAVTFPRGAIVRFKDGRHAMYRVTYDFGLDGAGGEGYCEIEPFPNVFDDEPTAMPCEVLELVPDDLPAGA